MNRIEALQAAFNVAGPNVTAEEHIQYAEFLLGDQNEIILEDRITRGYTPHDFIGGYVDSVLDDDYPEGTVALDVSTDVWVKTGNPEFNGWEMYYSEDGTRSPGNFGARIAEGYEAVIVA